MQLHSTPAVAPTLHVSFASVTAISRHHSEACILLAIYAILATLWHTFRHTACNEADITSCYQFWQRKITAEQMATTEQVRMSASQQLSVRELS
jgi:hypothetical protein